MSNFKSGYYRGDDELDTWLGQITNPIIDSAKNEVEEFYDNASVFLQGSCQLFAYALNEFFGYEVIEIRQDGSPHYFCKSVIQGTPIYIDVRGATSDLKDFVYGLKFITNMNCTEIKHRKEELIDELKEDGAKFGYDFAKHIIKTHKHYYDLIF